jgi:hypothetical protein
VCSRLTGLGRASSAGADILGSMIVEPGHADGTRTVHLTHTTLVVVALCGETIDSHDHPDLAVLCDECFALAQAEGADVSLWMTEIQVEALLSLAA